MSLGTVGKIIGWAVILLAAVLGANALLSAPDTTLDAAGKALAVIIILVLIGMTYFRDRMGIILPIIVPVVVVVVLAIVTLGLAPTESFSSTLKLGIFFVIGLVSAVAVVGLFPLVMLGILVVGAVVLMFVVNLGGLYNGASNTLAFLFTPDARVDPNNIVICRQESGCSTIHAFVYSALFLFIIITGFAYTTLLERRVIAWFQHRVGPNRVGPSGLLQPAADAVKLITKEDITPAGADYIVWLLAPMIKAIPTLIVVAVIPLGPDILLPWFDGRWYQVPLGLSDTNVGVLWVLAIMSIGTYGVVLAGWASNNKYAMIGGLRATAQMISYELSLGLALTVPIILAASMNVRDIVDAQNTIPVLSWYVFQNPVAAAIMIIALFAEVNRAPFDLPEAEQELTAGFMTEYSGMKFALFMMAEYLGMIGVSMIAASMFFGGYHFILVDQIPILGPIFLIGKVVLALMFFIWVRATVPRIRYDRLMSFGWKVMLPLALVAVSWTAIATVIGDAFQSPAAYMIISGVMFVLVIAGAYMVLGRAGRAEAEEDRLEDDPIVTGERRGIGYAVLQVVGGLLAIPFALVGLLAWTFDIGRRMGETSKKEIVAAEKPARRAPAKSGGSD